MYLNMSGNNYLNIPKIVIVHFPPYLKMTGIKKNIVNQNIMSKENEHQYARGQEIKSQIQNQKNSLGKILNSIIKANSDSEVKLTHEDDLGIEIYDKEEASIEKSKFIRL